MRQITCKLIKACVRLPTVVYKRVNLHGLNRIEVKLYISLNLFTLDNHKHLCKIYTLSYTHRHVSCNMVRFEFKTFTLDIDNLLLVIPWWKDDMIKCLSFINRMVLDHSRWSTHSDFYTQFRSTELPHPYIKHTFKLDIQQVFKLLKATCVHS